MDAGEGGRALSTILDMVKKVTVFLLAATLCTNLFSGSEYRKYFNFATGLIVIVLVLTPVLTVFQKDNDMKDILLKAVSGQREQQAEEEIKMLGKRYEQSVKKSFEQKLRQDVAAQCKTTKENCQIRFSDNRITQITVRTVEKPENVTALVQSLSIRYGVDEDNIYIICD